MTDPGTLPMPAPRDYPAGQPRAGKLETGWVPQALIHDLARKEHTRAALARKYRVARSAVTQFADRHADEIAELETEILAEFTDIWIADKRARILVHQAEVEAILTREHHLADEIAKFETAEVDEREGLAKTIEALSVDGPAWARVKQQALRAVADELGQIPAKMQLIVDQAITHVIIEGVDLDDL